MENFDYRAYLLNNALLREDREVDMWNNMDEEERLYTLLSIIKDPDEAESYVNASFYQLPDHITAQLNVNSGDAFDDMFKGTTPDDIDF